MPNCAFLLRIADRLGAVPEGSAAADAAIHRALGLPGPPPAYTTDAAALRTLLPDGARLTILTDAGGQYYAAAVPQPGAAHSGQWGATPPLAMAGAVMRMLTRGAPPH